MSTPAVVHGDVEQTLRDHLLAQLVASTDPVTQGVTIGVALDDHPPRYVLVRLAGGASPRLGVDVPRVDVQCWHDTDRQALDLAALVRAWLQQARGVGLIRGVRESARPTPIPDPSSGAHRYLQTVDLTLRGVPL